MNLLDRAISYFAPRIGLARSAARDAIHIMEQRRGWEAARPIRGQDHWRASGASPNAMIARDRKRLANLASALVRNNKYGKRVVRILASNIVGGGMQASSRTGDDKLDKKVDALWQDWCASTADTTGRTTFAGLQTQAVRAMVERGEALCRFRPRRSSDGYRVPLQLQLLDGDYLDDGKTGRADASGNVLDQGIQFDALDNRVGYWLFRHHPGDVHGGTAGSILVPASEVLHLFEGWRIAQNRGVTWLAPLLRPANDADDLETALIMKSKVEACFAGFITKKGGVRAPLVQGQADGQGRRYENLEPGMLAYLADGEEVTFANPTSSGGFEPIMLHVLMGMAVGGDVTYDQLTGDLRQANYSSLRAGKVEQRRLIEQVQYQTLIPQFCAPARRRFLATAILAGELPDRAYPTEWLAPRHEPIDPLKDALADIALVRAGAMPPQEFIARHGWDWKDVLTAYADFYAAADAEGLIFDSDPRKTAGSGKIQAPDLVTAEARP